MLIPVTPATVEPVTLDEAKAHLRVIHDGDDTRIAALISAAREVVESNTGRALAAASYRWVTDLAAPVSLPLWPAAVTEVSELDASDTRVVLDVADYTFDADRGVLRIDHTARALNVMFDVDPDHVPAALKAAILLIVGELYENTEASTDKPLTESPAVARLIYPHRLNLGV